MKPKLFLTILASYLCLVVQLASATEWRVNSNSQTNPDFTSINAAMLDSRVRAGDILSVEQGTSITTPQTITKRVSVIGPGYAPQGNGIRPIHFTAEINIEADGTRLSQLSTNAVNVRANEVTLENCYTGNINGEENYESDDVAIRACFINGTVYAKGSWGWELSNNIIYTTNALPSVRIFNNSRIDHNIICNYMQSMQSSGAMETTGCTITNNIIIRRYSGTCFSSGSSGSISRNLLSESTSNSSYPNNKFGCSSLSEIFTCTSNDMAKDTYWQLADNSPAKGYANNGGDCGPWSGTYPYKLNGGGETPPAPATPPTITGFTFSNTQVTGSLTISCVVTSTTDELVDCIEYYWDSDPGYGNAHQITFTPGSIITLSNYNIDISGLTGQHTLYVRARVGNLWATVSQAFNIEQGGQPGHYTLDVNATENAFQHIYNSLQTLFLAIINDGLQQDIQVSVADGTYVLFVSTKDLSGGNGINDLTSKLDQLQSDIQGVSSMLQSITSSNYKIYMEAPNEAVFQFYVTTSVAIATLTERIVEERNRIANSGLNETEKEQQYAALANCETKLAAIVAGCRSALQELITHLITTNISILIDGNMYRNYDGFEIDPNDLLALRNIYNRLNGTNWIRKWSFANNGHVKEDFPGVSFDGTRVIGIELENNGLEGELSNFWNPLLTELTYLNMSRNRLTGDLAPFVADMPKLRTLIMNHNRLTAISDALPQSVASLDVRSQNRVYSSSLSESNESYILEVLNSLMPIAINIGDNNDLELPSLFTYNQSARNNTLRPDILVQSETSALSQIGFLSHTYGNTWLFQADNNDFYNQPQDCRVMLTPDANAQRYSVYPATLHYLLGDVNMDGYTDVLDVQQTLNYILATATPFNYSAANTYYDGTINVQDIVCTVNIVLGTPANSRANSRFKGETGNDTDLCWVYSENGRVVLAPMTDVAAIDIELLGVTTDQVSLLLNRKHFQMVGRNTERGSRYIIFSPDGHTIPTSSATAILAMSEDGEPINVQCADTKAHNIPICNNAPTGISAAHPAYTLNAHFSGNQLIVTTNNTQGSVRVQVSTASGINMLNELFVPNHNETVIDTQLPSGMYIVNLTATDGSHTIVKLLKK